RRSHRSRLSGGGVLALVGGMHGTTARVMTLATSTQAVEPPYRFLLDHMSNVVWSGPARGGLTFVGGSVAAICGFTPAEVLSASGNLWMDRVHPDDRQRVQQGFLNLRCSGTPFEAEYRWQRKDGTW